MEETALQWYATKTIGKNSLTVDQKLDLLSQAKVIEFNQHNELFKAARKLDVFKKGSPFVFEDFVEYYNKVNNL